MEKEKLFVAKEKKTEKEKEKEKILDQVWGILAVLVGTVHIEKVEVWSDVTIAGWATKKER